MFYHTIGQTTQALPHIELFYLTKKKKMTEINLLQKAFELYKIENSSMPFKAWATLFLRKTQRMQQKILKEYGLA